MTLLRALRPNAIQKDDSQSRFGVIETSILGYLTPLMIIVAGIIIGIVAANIPILAEYFNTNVYLNGLIIFLLGVALLKAFGNNYGLYKTANFLKEVEDVCNAGNIDPNRVDKLQRKLVKSAYFIDTQNMKSAIENIKTFESLNLTDNDCRLIKHKLGYRIGLRRSEAGFIAGILVMLGLLGTFLGLLKTIDAVGMALNSMSAVGDGADDDAMMGFISSLSAPLQGMGLAFSSSLFGLSGSLLIGYFNHLCGGAQDKFIENVGRWLDDRIPNFHADDDVMPGEEGGLASEDDLRSWLTGFVHLSVKTNKQIAGLIQSLTDSMKQQSQNEEYLKRISTLQDETLNTTREFSGTLIDIKDNNKAHHDESMGLIADNNNHTAALKTETLSALQKLSADLSISQNQLLQRLEDVSSALGKSLAGVSNSNANTATIIEDLGKTTSNLSSTIIQNSHSLNAQLETLNQGNHNANALFQELKEISGDSNQTLLRIREALQETYEIQKSIQALLDGGITVSGEMEPSAGTDTLMPQKIEKALFEMNALINKFDKLESDLINKKTDKTID